MTKQPRLATFTKGVKEAALPLLLITTAVFAYSLYEAGVPSVASIVLALIFGTLGFSLFYYSLYSGNLLWMGLLFIIPGVLHVACERWLDTAASDVMTWQYEVLASAVFFGLLLMFRRGVERLFIE